MKNNAYDYGDEYAFGEDVEYITPKIKHNIWPCGNQGKNKETKSACTIVGAVNQLIRLFGIDLDMEKTNKLYIEVVKYCAENGGYVIGSGWSIPTAVNYVCKWWNEIGYKTFKEDKAFWLRLYWNNEKIKEALDNGHLVGFGKTINFGKHQVEGLVYGEPSIYPKMVGHRLNWKGVAYTKATGGADISGAERGAQDNYHGAIGENFAFKEVKPYINKGMYAYGYVIMPCSCMKDSVEDEKKKILRLKAVNSVIGVLSSTYGDLNNEEQLMSSALATELRNTEGSRKKIEEQDKKVYQAVVDLLSYAWKFAGNEEQEKYSELANFLRNKHKLQ